MKTFIRQVRGLSRLTRAEIKYLILSCKYQAVIKYMNSLNLQINELMPVFNSQKEHSAAFVSLYNGIWGSDDPANYASNNLTPVNEGQNKVPANLN